MFARTQAAHVEQQCAELASSELAQYQQVYASSFSTASKASLAAAGAQATGTLLLQSPPHSPRCAPLSLGSSVLPQPLLSPRWLASFPFAVLQKNMLTHTLCLNSHIKQKFSHYPLRALVPIMPESDWGQQRIDSRRVCQREPRSNLIPSKVVLSGFLVVEWSRGRLFQRRLPRYMCIKTWISTRGTCLIPMIALIHQCLLSLDSLWVTWRINWKAQRCLYMQMCLHTYR